MTMKEGEGVKSNLTRKLYKVKMIKDRVVVLEAEDGSSQILTNRGNLKLFYEKVENENSPEDFQSNISSHL